MTWQVTLLVAGCVETPLQFKVVDVDNKLPLAKVEVSRYRISRSFFSKNSGADMEPLPPTDQFGLVHAKGISGVSAFRFRLEGYLDAAALMGPGKTVGVITPVVAKDATYTYECDPNSLMVIQLYPKRTTDASPR
jgi:hypothetical protein